MKYIIKKFLHDSAKGILFKRDIIEDINIDKSILSSRLISFKIFSSKFIVISLCFSIGSSNVFKRQFINDWLNNC